ncbi:hypothetical protein PHLCEN_2v4724 [Hermanssonia centrifuga]|uniref:Uncharacterized protein n=1 Tax=Hermanssonia centrifuga TaxID=98765 RepID=A0A2R6PJE6_9APHY|nr:hypothetical protein PHLCEN_2v4724 [Hermanssonia centrifuga]
MSQGNVDRLLELWAASLLPYEALPPLASVQHLLETVDLIPFGDAPWTSFKARYTGDLPPDPPPWMSAEYEIAHRDPLVCVRNMLANPDFADEFDVAPYREYNHLLKRQYTNLLSGDWAWDQADIIAEDPETHGAMFCPLILGSDKTTVSVATGQNEYHPVYMSLGNVWNNVRRAHRNAILIIAFLSIPKTEKRYANNAHFRHFRRELFHASLSFILSPLRTSMLKPEVTRCPDGHFRRVIYGLGPYIADYMEQIVVTAIVQNWCVTCPTRRQNLQDFYQGFDFRTREHAKALAGAVSRKELWDNYGIISAITPFSDDFPRADIHELIAGDLLHQVIKGCFKDHLVDWVFAYILLEHGETKGHEIWGQIDRRLAAVPTFPGLRPFHQGRDFKQWTGDDSKGLMKIFLPAVVNFIPPDMTQAIKYFMEFCYLVRRSIQTEDTVARITHCLERYHHYRHIFVTTGVRPDGFSSLPLQHSADHYPRHIRQFGAPNGLCSSITESKHIKAVKEPWRRSNKYNPLAQMLTTNQRTDKLAAARADFTDRHMLQGSCLSEALQDFLSLALDEAGLDDSEDGPGESEEQQGNAHESEGTAVEAGDDVDEDGAIEGPRVLGDVSLARQPERTYPRTLPELGLLFGVPDLTSLVSTFLYDQTHPEPLPDGSPAPPPCLPVQSIKVYHSAAATFYAPSDISGIGGMRRERIRATPSWFKGPARYDCVFAENDSTVEGFRGLHAARVRTFLSFKSGGVEYPCALIQWFSPVADEPDELTGLWVVEPDFDGDNRPFYGVIHLDSILRLAHLIPVFGNAILPPDFHQSQSLDAFKTYYVNKYADHHAHEIAF